MFPFLPPLAWYVHQCSLHATPTAVRSEKALRQYTRTRILGANGPQFLHLPIDKNSLGKAPEDVQLVFGEPWQRKHWQALQSAYGKSAFFLFLADDLQEIFFQPSSWLHDYTQRFEHYFAKRLTWSVPSIAYPWEAIQPRPYLQVFHYKFGFTPHLSIVDYLFNCGLNLPAWDIDTSWSYGSAPSATLWLPLPPFGA